jgi:uncharacterized membrane protein YkoI
MHPRYILTIALLSILGFTASAAPADVPLTQSPYRKEAKIDPATARANALKAYPGTIVSEEIEREKGGSGLRYSFDIKKDNAAHEVGIDAKTGTVLENSVEGPNAD